VGVVGGGGGGVLAGMGSCL